jgi:hypothetical protein
MTAPASTASTRESAPPAEQAGWLSRDSNGVLLGAALVYVLVYALFLPRINTTMDEAAYLNMAWALRHGTVFLDKVGITGVMSYWANGHMITQYPPGMPFVLAVTSLLGWKAALCTNLLMSLALFAVMIKLLRTLKLPAFFAILLLLHPTAVTFSRTVMSDLTSCLLLTTAFLCYLNRRYFLIGILVGLTIMIKTASGIALPLFLLALLFEPSLNEEVEPAGLIEKIKSGALIVAGALPFIVGAWLYQRIWQDGGWAKYSSGGQLGLHNFPHVFTGYVVMLMLLYPGILVAPLLYRGRGRVALWCLTYGTLFFYSCYHFQDSTDSKLQSLVLGQRYLLGSVLPLFIVAYAAILWRFLEKWNKRVVTALGGVGLAALLLAMAYVQKAHDKYLHRSAEVRTIAARVIGPNDQLFLNVHMAKLLHPAWTGTHSFTLFDVFTGQVSADVSPEKLFEYMRKGQQTADSASPKGRVLVAHWSRLYRPDTEGEHTMLGRINSQFVLRRLPESQQPNGTDELEFFEVVAERSFPVAQASTTTPLTALTEEGVRTGARED